MINLRKTGVTAIALLAIIGGLTQVSFADDNLQVEKYATEVSQDDPQLLSANPWYYTDIVLPRFGTDWWTTTARNKTRIYPGTGVDKPTYTVVSNIFRGSTTTGVGQNITHPANQNTNGWHTVGSSEKSIRGAFRNSITNVNTNKVSLRWSP